MENPYRRADLTDRDSQGNTVLHTLVVIADNTQENTDMVARMYDEILILHNKLERTTKVKLEAIENNQGLTPLKLAAKFGKIGVGLSVYSQLSFVTDVQLLCLTWMCWSVIAYEGNCAWKSAVLISSLICDWPAFQAHSATGICG